MSRTKGHGTCGQNNSKSDRPGWEGYDSRRPMRWRGFGKEIKKITHKIERRKEKKIVSKMRYYNA